MLNQQELLRLAIQGLEIERARIDTLLSELKSQVSGAPAVVSTPAISANKKRSMSAEGRANIRAAIKRRWKAFHEGKAKAPNASGPAKKKRVLSKAQLMAMRQNAAKARAARHPAK